MGSSSPIFGVKIPKIFELPPPSHVRHQSSLIPTESISISHPRLRLFWKPWDLFAWRDFDKGLWGQNRTAVFVSEEISVEIHPWKLTFRKSPFSIGNTSSNGGFSLVMLVFGGYFSWWIIRMCVWECMYYKTLVDGDLFTSHLWKHLLKHSQECFLCFSWMAIWGK